jgi:CPA1 family monovalent cation:H+ antiporter
VCGALSAALGVPLTTQTGAPFLDRDLILFVTFGVIIITLVGQGLLLPSVVRWLGLARHVAEEREREHKAELAARSEALTVAQNRLVDVALVAAELRSNLIAAEREYIYQLLRVGRITDEARRRIERELDLEEAGVACKK